MGMRDAAGVNRRGFLATAGLTLAGLMVSGFRWPWAGSEPKSSVLIAGSTTVLPYSKELAAAFMAANPDVEVIYDGGGTTAGLIALQRGAVDIAAMSRDIRRAEDSWHIKNVMIGKDAIAIAVAPENPIRALSRAQVRGILEGKLTNWSAVGGPDAAIEIIQRKAGSTTRKGLEEMVLDHGEVPRQAMTVESARDMVAAIAARPHAIGYLAMKDLLPGVIGVDIDGIPLNRPTLYSGRYPYTRSLYYVTGVAPNETVRRFLAFVRSPDGQDVIENEILRVY